MHFSLSGPHHNLHREVIFFPVNPVSQTTSSWGFRIKFLAPIVTEVRAARFVCPTRLESPVRVGLSDFGDDTYRVALSETNNCNVDLPI